MKKEINTLKPPHDTGLFIGYLNLPTALTLSGVVLACLSIIFSATGQLPLAVISLIYAGLCDLFDGWVARKCKLSEHEQEYGIYIDTVADMASFGVAPAFLIYHAGLNSPIEIIAILFYICSAGTRLAYFNTLATKIKGPVSHYTGLPVTYAALIFPVVLYFSYSPTQEISTPPVNIALWILALGFILRIPIPLSLIHI